MKKMTKRIRVLLDEWDLLIEKHEQALLADDIETARKYGDEISDFMERHCKTLNIPDEQMAGMRRSRAEADASWQKSKIAEARLQQARRASKDATEKYHAALLELPPEGKNRTSH